MTERARQAAIDWQIRLQQTPNNRWLRWRFQQWLSAAPQHQQAWAEVCQLWQLSAELAPAPAIERVAKPRKQYSAWLALAACAALMTVSLLHGLASSPNQGQRQADNSLIWPRPGSQLEINYSPEQRHVQLLSGAAYFDVTKQTRPFVVQAGPVKVEVVGTAFSVTQLSDKVVVAVERGQVRVNGQPLRAEQQAQVPIQQADQVVVSNSFAQVAPWRSNILLALDTPLSELVEQLDAVYPGYIRLTDHDLAAHSISGRFDLQNPEQALQQIARTAGAEVENTWPGLLQISPAKNK